MKVPVYEALHHSNFEEVSMHLTISEWNVSLNEGAVLEQSCIEIVQRDGFSMGKVLLKSGCQKNAFAENDALKMEVRFEQKPDEILAFYMRSDSWMFPAFCEDFRQVPDRTNVILAHGREDCIGLLALPGNTFKTRFTAGTGTDTLSVVMSAYRVGPAEMKEDAFMAVTESDPYRCMEKLMEEAAKYAGIADRKQRKYPEMFEKLGWCSWNALYRELFEENLLEKAREIREKQIPFQWILLDDGWMDIKEGCLRKISADPAKFPEGLKSTVKKIKKVSGAGQVGVWHAFEGYWEGIGEGNEVFEQEKENLISTVQGRWLPAPDSEKAYRFFSDWHHYLKGQEIDFLKVDAQSPMLNHYQKNADIGEAARQLHRGLERSVRENMDNCLINCMGMDTQNMLAREASPIARNSDDFYPERENGFEKHLMQNAYNSLYHTVLYHGDWDMFWSSHPDAQKHAILRALSGGPVYVSDKIGESDPAVLMRLCYKDGTILRADHAAVPTRDCLFLNPVKSGYLKIKNVCNGVYYLAIFNYADKENTVSWQLSDVLDQKGEVPDCAGSAKNAETADGAAYRAARYAVYGFCRQSCEIVTASEQKSCALEGRGYELYLIAPVVQGIAVFGLQDKYLASHALERIVHREDGLEIDAKESGKFLAYCEVQPKHIRINGTKAAAARLGRDLFLLHIMEAG